MNASQSKYLDPRWQRRRLEVMERDQWACVRCRAADRTLHVHHMRYDGELWDTPCEYLQTLCEGCHEALGEHPKGGVWWDSDGGFVWSHCPMCGGTEFRDKGSSVKCLGCAHPISHPELCGVELPPAPSKRLLYLLGWDAFRDDVRREKPILATFVDKATPVSDGNGTLELAVADPQARESLNARLPDLTRLVRHYLPPLEQVVIRQGA